MTALATFRDENGDFLCDVLFSDSEWQSIVDAAAKSRMDLDNWIVMILGNAAYESNTE